MADGQAPAPVSGTVTVPGFEPGREYDVEWWDTWADAEPARRAVRSDRAGALTLEVEALAADVAVLVRPASAPSGTKKEGSRS